MGYIRIDEAAAKWGVSVRRAQDLCKMGKIYGAKKYGASWMVPSTAVRPADGRRKAERDNPSAYRPLVRKSPFLYMTNLYTTPGTADEVAESLTWHPEAKKLFEAEIAFGRGEIDTVYGHATDFLEHNNGFYATLSGGMLLALVAIWKGDVELWHKAKKHIYDAPWKDENDRDIIALSAASVDLYIRNTKDFPEWFRLGRFEHLPADSHPAARVFYIKYLLVLAQEHAAKLISIEDTTGMGLLRSHPYIMEPMISQAVVDKIVMAEIYLRLLCSASYHQTGDDTNAAFHLDRAIKLCLADHLYGPLVEHRRQLGLFLDERLLLIDPDAVKKVKELHKGLHEGRTALYNAVMSENITAKLSDREHEVVRLVAFGLSDDQISTYLHITKSSVKSIIQMARNKTGIKYREDFAAYL